MKTKEEYYEAVLENRGIASDPAVLMCPCAATLCEWHGRCRECVALHRHHGDHVPACLQPVINGKLKALVGVGELVAVEKERTPDEYRLYVRQRDRESSGRAFAIRPLDAALRPAVDRYIRSEWAGPLVVTLGEPIDSSALPGFAASVGEDLKGAVLYQVKNSECEIVVLFSLEEGRGIASRLIDAVVSLARGRGCKRVWLVTTNDNARAIRFYQRRGFDLKAVHRDAMDRTREVKPGVPLLGIDDIPLRHTLEFEILL